jgi:hypothetical protein
MSSIAGLLRLASLVICLIVIASFAVFAVDQAKGASTHQQEALTDGTPSNTNGDSPRSSGTSTTGNEGSVHKTIDEASNTFTSPFSEVTSGSKNAWTIHGANLLLALVIYGFGLGFLARVVQGKR